MALTLIIRFSPKDTGNIYKIEIVQASNQNFLGQGSFFGISINISSTERKTFQGEGNVGVYSPKYFNIAF